MMIRLAIALAMLVGLNVAAHADIRCARLSGGAVAEYRVFSDTYIKMAELKPGQCPPNIPQKGVVWLPAPKAVPPAFDPDTQDLAGPTITIGGDAVTEEYTVTDKPVPEPDAPPPPPTPAEIDASHERLLGDITFLLKTLCDHESRLRALEGKGAVTFAQCRAAVKALMQ